MKNKIIAILAALFVLFVVGAVINAIQANQAKAEEAPIVAFKSHNPPHGFFPTEDAIAAYRARITPQTDNWFCSEDNDVGFTCISPDFVGLTLPFPPVECAFSTVTGLTLEACAAQAEFMVSQIKVEDNLTRKQLYLNQLMIDFLKPRLENAVHSALRTMPIDLDAFGRLSDAKDQLNQKDYQLNQRFTQAVQRRICAANPTTCD